MVLLRPSRLVIQASVDKPSWEPLRSEVVDDLRLAEENEEYAELPLLVTVPMHTTTPLHIEVGNKDLVAELNGPVLNDFACPPSPPSLVPSSLPSSPAMATVSRDFVRGVIKFGPSCPANVVNKAIDLVLAHW